MIWYDIWYDAGALLITSHMSCVCVCDGFRWSRHACMRPCILQLQRFPYPVPHKSINVLQWWDTKTRCPCSVCRAMLWWASLVFLFPAQPVIHFSIFKSITMDISVAGLLGKKQKTKPQSLECMVYYSAAFPLSHGCVNVILIGQRVVSVTIVDRCMRELEA